MTVPDIFFVWISCFLPFFYLRTVLEVFLYSALIFRLFLNSNLRQTILNSFYFSHNSCPFFSSAAASDQAILRYFVSFRCHLATFYSLGLSTTILSCFSFHLFLAFFVSGDSVRLWPCSLFVVWYIYFLLMFYIVFIVFIVGFIVCFYSSHIYIFFFYLAVIWHLSSGLPKVIGSYCVCPYFPLPLCFGRSSLT